MWMDQPLFHFILWAALSSDLKIHCTSSRLSIVFSILFICSSKYYFHLLNTRTSLYSFPSLFLITGAAHPLQCNLSAKPVDLCNLVINSPNTINIHIQDYSNSISLPIYTMVHQSDSMKLSFFTSPIFDLANILHQILLLVQPFSFTLAWDEH